MFVLVLTCSQLVCSGNDCPADVQHARVEAEHLSLLSSMQVGMTEEEVNARIDQFRSVDWRSCRAVSTCVDCYVCMIVFCRDGVVVLDFSDGKLVKKSCQRGR